MSHEADRLRRMGQAKPTRVRLSPRAARERQLYLDALAERVTLAECVADELATGVPADDNPTAAEDARPRHTGPMECPCGEPNCSADQRRASGDLPPLTRWEARVVKPPPTGRELADAAIQQVDEHAAPDWKDAALDAVRQLCDAGDDFTTDDVWFLLIGAPAGSGPAPTTHEPRAMGAIMRRASKLGWCRPLDQWRVSSRPEAHANPKRVWRPTRAASGERAYRVGETVWMTWEGVRFAGVVGAITASDVYHVLPVGSYHRLASDMGASGGWTATPSVLEPRDA